MGRPSPNEITAQLRKRLHRMEQDADDPEDKLLSLMPPKRSPLFHNPHLRTVLMAVCLVVFQSPSTPSTRRIAES
jgi:hypothetical protein